MRRQFFLRDGFNAKLFAPVVQDVRGRAMIEAAIDFAAASYAPPFDVSHFIFPQSYRLAAVPIFLHHLFPGKWLARFEFMVGTFLDQEHVPPRLRKQTR